MLMEIKTVTNAAVEYLRTQIVTGNLKANQKISENELASTLGVSRLPIREAFRVLENEHLVVNVPRKGTFVSDVSMEDLLGLSQVREMIESHVIELLKNKNIKRLPLVEAALEKASRLPLPLEKNTEEILQYHVAFSGFHIKLVEAAENYRITHFYKALCPSLTRYQILYLFFPGSGELSLQSHRQILSYIEMGEYDEARKNLLNHIRYTTEILQKSLLEKKENAG